MKNFVIFTGQLRNKELFTKSISELLILRSEGMLENILFSTWIDQSLMTTDIEDFLRENDIKILKNTSPGSFESSIWHQMKSLEIGLDNCPDDSHILKTRTDVYIDSNFLRKLFSNEIIPKKSKINKFRVFSEKIWVPWAEITKPFYIADECFYGLKEDIKKLINYDASLDIIFDIDAGKGHIRRFIPPFKKVLNEGYFNYLKYFAKTGHNTKYRFWILSRLLKNKDYIDILATYYLILKENFHIEGTNNIVSFRQWSSISKAVNLRKIDDYFSDNFSIDENTGMINIFNMEFFDLLMESKFINTDLMINLQESMNYVKKKNKIRSDEIKNKNLRLKIDIKMEKSKKIKKKSVIWFKNIVNNLTKTFKYNLKNVESNSKEKQNCLYQISDTCQIPKLNSIYEQYFGIKTDGFFVEVGAFDGESFSNTSGLADIGWKGHYIEAIPEYFQACKKRHAKNNNVEVHNIAISNKKKNLNFIVSGALTSSDKKTVDLFKSLDWSKNIVKDSNKKYSIKAITLNKFFEINKIPKNIDLLVVDVEGSESDVFKGFDLKVWQPKMLIVELHDQNTNYQDIWNKDKELYRFILDHNYLVVYKDYTNTVFVKYK